MNKIEIIYKGEIPKGYRKKSKKGVWPGMLMVAIGMGRKGILRGVKINAPKLPKDSVVILRKCSNELISGKLWMFEGGMIPLDIDLNNPLDLELEIENSTTRIIPIEVAISRELRSEEMLT